LIARNPVKDFQSAQGAAAMLVSLKAAGTGITLHAADYVFLLDPWWNPAVEDQAIDRVHRIGQTNTVFVYRMGHRPARSMSAIRRSRGEKKQLFQTRSWAATAATSSGRSISVHSTSHHPAQRPSRAGRSGRADRPGRAGGERGRGCSPRDSARPEYLSKALTRMALMRNVGGG
jgi:hypothetical protein